MSNNALPERVHNLRKIKNLTQGELAKTSGVSQAYLSQIETGEANPTVATLQRIADALDVPARELMR